MTEMADPLALIACASESLRQALCEWLDAPHSLETCKAAARALAPAVTQMLAEAWEKGVRDNGAIYAVPNPYREEATCSE